MTTLAVSRSLSRCAVSATVKRSFAAQAPSSLGLVKTALYDLHLELGGDMVPFAGYALPVLYKGENGGVMKEHLWCREQGKASLFDVSHMGQVCQSDSIAATVVVLVVVVVVVVVLISLSVCKKCD